MTSPRLAGIASYCAKGPGNVLPLRTGSEHSMRRRDFLKLVIGGSVISLGAEPLQFDKLIPSLVPQDQLVPGVSTWYATTCRECPAGCGQLIRNREGRATKAEGNPLHPINAGTLCARGQASLHGLYDPDRIKGPLNHRQRPVGWQTALTEIGSALARLQGTGRVAVISDLQTGSLAALIADWLKAFGSERYLVYEPFNYEPLREANRFVFGQAAIPDYHLDRCDFIISFAADFLETWISPVKFIRRFAQTRVPSDGKMSRFVYVGPRASMTAFSSDEYLLVAPGDERWLALAMLQMMVAEGLVKSGPPFARIPAGLTPERVSERIGVPADKIRSLARQFGRAEVPLALAGAPVAGGRAAVESAAAANLLNYAAATPAVDFGRLHALGATATAAQTADFVGALADGKIDALVVIGANPAYSLPQSYRFAEALNKVPTVISLTSSADETGALATWVLPSHTPLESWGDYEPETGLASLMQPIMGPRHDTRAAGDILLALARTAGVDVQQHFGATSTAGAAERPRSLYYDYLRQRWLHRAKRTEPSLPEDQSWQNAVRQGGRWEAEPAIPLMDRVRTRVIFSPPEPRPALSLWTYPSALLHDGRGANKRWLQEIPDVVNHAVWGSWIEVHPDTAAKHDIAAGQALEVRTSAGSVRAPAFLYPGVAPDTLTLAYGQGHTAYGRYAAGRGANAFVLVDPRGDDDSVEVTRRLGQAPVITTDGGVTQEGRGLVQAVLLSELPRQRPRPLVWPLPEGYGPDTDLYPPHPHVGHRWAMAIDLARCVGCSACVAACYAENNVGVVGKDWVAQGREMSWLRIERYYQWESPHTPALFLPMLCQHCDAAPCEPVCPTFAASHTEEGLNAQVYNRCIGTRYCSNNCPYKARRFNWRDYDWPDELTWQLNPDVTVRCRGVMEKCTLCVQRIREAEAHAKKEGRPLRDGEITPACAQTCPAGVFVFGDLMDPDSGLSRLVRSDSRRFQVLPQLNTKPAIIYLQRIINDLEPA